VIGTVMVSLGEIGLLSKVLQYFLFFPLRFDLFIGICVLIGLTESQLSLRCDGSSVHIAAFIVTEQCFLINLVTCMCVSLERLDWIGLLRGSDV